MAKIYSVKVINPSKISQSIKIANPGKGETVIIRAESGDKFQLIEEQSANSPHKVFVKRVEDNLYVLFEEGNIQKPDLIIEQYYFDDTHALIGGPQSGNLNNYIADISEQTITTAQIASDNVSDWFYLPHDDNAGLLWGFLGAGLTAGLVLSGSSDHNAVPTTKTVNLPEVNEDSGTIIITQAQLISQANDTNNDVLKAGKLQASVGTIVDNGDGTWTLTLPKDYNGELVLNYTIDDGHGGIVTGTAIQKVAPVSDIVADEVTATEDEALTSNVLGNDTFEGTAVITSVTQGTHGTVVINGDNTITYKPDADYNGTDSYTYTVTSGGVTETATVNVTVGKVQDIAADSVTTDEDTAITTDVLANDTFEAAPAVTSVTQGTHGTVVINGDNTITYTPDADYNGQDSYTYTVTSGGVTETATVNVTVGAVQDIAGDSITTDEDTAITTAVLANDTFEATAEVTSVTQGSHGNVVINGDNTITYTPDADYNGEDSYTYTVTSGGVTETATVSVTINPINDSPVITSNGSGTTAALNVAENSTAVTTVTSTDVDAAATATYSIVGGADASKFTIDASTGALSFVSAPDFENKLDAGSNNVYDVTVQVSDGLGGADTQAIAVTVTNVNEAPVITSNGGGATATPISVAENSTAVTTVTSTDVDASATATYSIVGGADQSKFEIDASTGALSFVSEPDYESPTDAGADNVYDVKVQVSDGSLTDTQDIAVTVTNVNESPVITSNGADSIAAVNVAENSTAVTMVTSTDVDASATATYSIVGGADASKFTIDASTGALSFVSAPDFENKLDAGSNNVYDVTVQVSDGLGGADTQAIAVTVTNVNEAPVIISNGAGTTAAVNVAENSTAVTTVISTDVDASATATYSIVGGADAAKFTINASTGVLSFVSAPNYESPTDAGTNNVYDVKVQVSDGSLTDTQDIAVTITNVNEAPVISSNGGGTTAAVNVAENSTAVTTVTSTDVDASATATYSIIGGADASKFTIDASTGVLSFVSAPDFENKLDAGSNNIYDVTVQVSDGLGGSDTQAIAVTVTNVNEAPVITSNGGGATATPISVSENSTTATTVTSTDVDASATATYSIVGGADASKFTIDASTGALSFKTGPNYEEPTDEGGNNVYDVKVQVSDGSLTDTQDIAVTVTNVNEAPIIGSNDRDGIAAVNVAENSTAVTTVTSTDADAAATATYSIIGGADAAKFTIDASTGALSFVSAPDYESPTDSGTNNVYDVKVQVSDGSLTDTQDIAVTVTNVNEAPIISSNGGATTAAVNIAENSTAVTTVTSTDIDAGATATYSIVGGADAAKFTIDASTGALSFVSAPDFENKLDDGGNNVYDVKVQVSDGTLTDTQDIAVTVTNVNEAPVISSNGGGTTAAVNVAENSTAVTTVTSTDVDASATATYSIVGGADAAKFTIDASTGALSFVSAPDFENKLDDGANNVYDVKVQVSDGSLTDTQDIAVTVTNVNEAPVIISNGSGTTADVNVAENSTAVTTVTSTDVDAAATATYSIVGGADAAKFTIDASTGALSFVSAPDYESPTDSGTNNVYNVKVQVSDGSLTDTQDIAVTVTNVNEAPAITSNGSGTTAALNVAENSTAVTTVTSNDIDAGATATYSIVGGADAAKFTINASTGALSFVSAPNYESPTDSGTNNVYDVQVQVSDGTLTDTQDIAVTVTNVNEAPVITSNGGATTAAVNVAENSTAVTTVTSTDVDASATATYSIVGGADASKFTIDASTGALSFVSAPDFENKLDAGADNVYDVTVQVSDGLGGADTQAIAVTVTNVNEAPVITSNGSGTTAALNVAENSTAVTTVTSTDIDAGATATYSIIGGADAAKFTIDASTGALSFKTGPNYESPTDDGGNNVYDVKVQVSDGTLTDTQDIAITVTNVNEAPVISSNGSGNTAAVNVAENSTAVTTVTSTDIDAAATATYSIVGGADAAKFTIDASTGALSFVSAPDFENKLDAGSNNVYDVTVQVSDGLGGTDTQAIAVTVTNVNEAPVITSNGGGTTASVNVAENSTAVTTVTSTDVDSAATATYSIVGGADSAKFMIDASTGALSFKTGPNYESPTDEGGNNVYDVKVQVSDGSLTDTQDLAVTITNVNEEPVITSNGSGSTAAVDVAENSTAVTIVTSTDIDAGATATYSIVGGADAAKFTIDASTGALSFVSAPDFENKQDAGSNNVYDVTVQVSDGLGGTDTQAIAVTVTNVNEAPVITSNGSGTTAALNVAENSTAVTTVTSTDVDAAATATYSIVGGADAAKFTIDASTGALSFVSAPDYESPTDSGANNVYDLTVRVSDGSLTDTQDIAVTVTNVNEAPVITSNGSGTTATVNVAENSTAVTTVTSTDIDAGATATYSIVGGADAAKFAINASTGALSFKTGPNYESPTDSGANNVYDVKVQVSDGSLTDTQDIAVTVTNVNEAPVITSNGSGTTAAVNVAENSTAVTTVTSNDIDAGATATYSIVGGADAAKFTIDASSGALSFVSAPDYESPTDSGANNVYDVTVRVSDGLGGTDTQSIAVTVTNVNEAPIISSNGSGNTAAVNVAENSTAVTTVTSTDIDAGATATYSIVGGADSAKFTIDSSTGALSFFSAPDFENKLDAGADNVYDVTVQVSDGLGGADTQAIAVTVTNVNEAPVITSNGSGTTAAVNVAENSTAVTTVTSTDVDAGATATYSIVGGADAAKFTIDASTGALSFVSAPNYELPTDAGANNVYDITVRVSDGLGGTDTQAIAVTVTNVNEAPVITSGAGDTAAVNVAENSTAVTTVTSTDIDAGATATYSIIGGADAAKFTIDASTGALSFVSAPDFENKLDAGANNVYDVTVQVSDGLGGVDTQAIAVTVTNVNEAPVITSNGGGTAAAVNVAENSTAVTTVTSTDVDAGATATYSIIGGADAAKFTIDASTGALSFVSTPNYESPTDSGLNNVYDVKVQVSDGSLKDTQDIAVTLTNVYEQPVITSNGSGSTAAVNVAENNTAVTTVQSVIDSTGTGKTYSITGGADAGLFTINSSTGALSFVSAPNYESPTDAGANNVYDVTVRVSDGAGGTDTQDIAVTVTNVNEAPVITSNGGGTTAAVNVAENSTAVTTVTSTDVDAGATATYSIIGGADSAKFNINASTGALSFVSTPNYESPTDAGANNVYDVKVQVSDGSLTDTQDIAVTVTNVYEQPVITSNSGGDTAAVNVAENSTAVTTVQSIIDSTGTGKTYSITGGADAGLFTINASTGALSFVSAPDFENKLDAGTNNVYDVTVQVSDGAGGTDTQAIAVTVTNVNEAPVITSDGGDTTAAINVAENTTVVTTVTSTDVDAGATATYSIVGGADSAKFNINASTGALSFKTAPNREIPTDSGANNVYDVRVQVSDGSLTDTQDIAVTVNNIYEQPVITSNGSGNTAAVNVAENNTAVTTVTSTIDSTGTGKTYSITGGADAALFTINASTGALRFVSAPNYESPADSEANNVYDVTVQVSDGVGGTDTQAIAVTVTNVNEAPVITSNGGGTTAAVSVAENSTVVTTVTSTDVDAAATATYSIVGGADASKFTINASTGALVFKTGPNYESPTDSGANNVYDVKVQVSDGSLTDTQDIAVTVTNVYEEPVISSNGSGSTAAVNVAENSTAVTNVTSVIDSTGTGKTYSITGGADASLFTINSSTGALSFVSAPDFENKLDAGTNNVYDVTVQVSDGVGGIDTQAIAVTVTNVNEAPVITSNGGGATATPISIVENSTAVTTVTSTDVDAGATATYSIVGGADAAKFTINASTGVLSFASAPNYEIPTDSGANNVYDVKVQVSDGSLTDTQDIAVTVTNVYEQPVISGGDTATVNVAENSTTVTTVPSVIDSTGTGKTYSITGGADASLFTINSSTGALSFVSAPNYESPTDSGTNNVYDVTVQVSDGLGGVDSQAITVNVTNVNEAPVITSNGGGATAAVSVAENSTAVTTVTSTDVDAGATATYSIVGGADASLFTINSSTGALSFVSAPNYESPTDIGANNVYDVIVQASDSLGGTDTQAIAVTVTNVNEPPTITSDGGGTTASLSVAENSTLVTTVMSTDIDAGAAKTYSIIGGADKDLFTINTTTGVLSFIAAPNREVPTDADGNNVYDVQVQVWDGGLADTQAIAVTVSNVYEPPVITSGGGGDTATYEISENASSVTTVNSDIDFGKVGTYTIIGGADASKFAINPATGALRFITAPNYEAPSDSDANGIYAVKVQVSDGVGGIDIQDITITVKDINEAPIISGNGAKASLVVSENTKAVTTVTATDVDASETLTYSISGTDAALFTIDSSTGALSFVNAPNYEVPADSGANNIYDVTVTVTDKGGLTSSRDMSISVANFNEAPEITNNAGAQSIGVNIAENTTKVLTVTSTDQDALAIARYSIVGGEDAAKFSINPTTGELRFINAPNYEAASDVLGDNIYNVTVQVSDTLGGTDTQSIAVTVTNVNEAPVITSNDGKAAAKISVAENSTTVTTVASTDVDAGATATYSIVGGADSAKFTIDASTGVLSFVSAPNYESPTDTGANNVYDVTVQVSDGLGGTDTQAIGVTVTNVNETPAITSNGGAALALNVAENTTAVTTIVSNDPEGSALTYSLTGVDAARFTIDSETGVLRFIQAPNYEGAADSGTNNVYNLQVQVSDGTLTDTQDIEVTVTNVNEAPAITSNGAGSGAAVSVAENTTAVTTVTASDAEGDALTYSISGTDAALFAIDASTGVLRFVSAPNYESPVDADGNNVYNLQVQVSDGSLVDTQNISVTVTNVNEAPVITSDGAASTAAVSVAENTSTAVTTVTASDQDAGDLNNLIYTIIGGADADMFAIDPHTGALAFAKVPDYEFKEDVGGDNIYDVVVQVTDGRLSDTQAIAVTVTNVNEAPVITSNGGGATAALSIAENTTAVTTVRSTDVDAGATATYSITGGDDAAKFVINASTGVLSFASAPDYETTFSANGDNIYDVQVQVSDGSLIDTQLISVTVDQVTPVIGADGIGIDREVDVNENTSTVTTVSSSLAGAVTYSIVNQYDADKFEINASTGVLSFKTAPDFETPADTDQNNVYNVAVNVTDGVGGTDTQVIAVNVTNVNEAPVITSNAGGESAAINVAENTTSVGTIQASDVDASTQLVYNIVGGADAALFYINPATGILRFINAPNFENPSSAGGNNVYDVQVQVSDGSLCDTQNIAVTVTNVNEAPEITSRSSVSVSENTTTVTTVTSFDVDAGATASYSITGGADAGLFTINASTGALSFVTAPNFESPADAGGNNIYDVQVTVSDGSLTDTQDIAVNVTNVNETTRITSDGGQDSASIRVMENTTAVTTVTSQDIDANANAIYSIVGGADASLFLIDPLSGKLRFISAPNYENKLDDGKNNVYDVTVQVSDGSLTDTQNIQVTVNDVNDAPVMTANSGSPIEISIDENTTEAIDVIKAADDDGQALTYSISGTDAALFNIDTATGALTFKASPNFEAPADADTDNVYSVNVTVSDGTLTDTQAVNITVEDANDAPVFTSGGGSGSTSVDIAENTVMVTTLAASDEDSDATQTYTIVGGADAALFSIDPSSGELQFIDVPDFEKQQDADKNNVYEVQVQVSDGTLTDIHNVSVTVTDVNEAPEITSNLGFKISLGIDENTTAVTTITASDVDLGATLKYSLVDGSDSALFSIDENSGVLSFKNSPDYEQKLDAGSDNIYDVTVQVSDGILTDTQDVSVKVNNVNEAPVLTANNGLTINADVEENSTSVTTITSGDVDADSVLSYSISGGVDAALFAINASTGELRFIAAPDYETPADAGSDNIYNVTVQVSDGILTDTQDIVVNVTNVNEAPVITSYSGTDSAAVDINENTVTVTTVVAADVDAGQTIQYSISGTDAGLFNIDASTGVLTFKNAPNFESAGDSDANNVYDVIVQASDGAGGVDTQTIAITVNDINENPFITSDGGGDTSTVDVFENSLFVTTVSASDPDSNLNFNKLTYSLSGTDAASFTIDAATGELNFVNAPDYETDAHSYSVRVEVTDNGYLTDYQDMTINLGNVDHTDLNFNSLTTDLVLTSYEEQIVIQDRSADEVSYSLAAGSTQITDVKDGVSGHTVEISDYANDLDGFFLTFSDGSLLKTATSAATLTGGSGDDQLIGSSFADTLIGAVGDDLLTGGEGSDIFSYDISKNEGHDTIVDFSDNADKINIAGGSYAGLTITAGADAGETLVTLSSGTTITLKGITAANINADDFTFVV